MRAEPTQADRARYTIARKMCGASTVSKPVTYVWHRMSEKTTFRWACMGHDATVQMFWRNVYALHRASMSDEATLELVFHEAYRCFGIAPEDIKSLIRDRVFSYPRAYCACALALLNIPTARIDGLLEKDYKSIKHMLETHGPKFVRITNARTSDRRFASDGQSS